MVSFSNLDIAILIGFFLVIIFIGFLPRRKNLKDADGYLLSGRKVGLFLFILTNVATWYGGILGVGEFTYRYGILSWFTQGLPYYIFALLLLPKVLILLYGCLRCDTMPDMFQYKALLAWLSYRTQSGIQQASVQNTIKQYTIILALLTRECQTRYYNSVVVSLGYYYRFWRGFRRQLTNKA